MNLKKTAFLFIVFAVVGSSISQPSFAASVAGAYESSEELFLRSTGQQALREGRFRDVLIELEVLSAIRPNDPYLLKTKGMVLLRMGEQEEGREFLKRALKLNPLDRQARFYLAEAYFKDKAQAEAKEQLRLIIENPDDLGYYEDKAQRALAVVESREVTYKPRKEEKRWKVSGTYGVEYDDNVPLQSDVKGFKAPGDRNAIRFNTKTGVNYEYFRDQVKRLGAAYFFSQSFHTDNVEEFNFRNHSIQHYGTYFTNLFGRPLTFGLKYTFSHGVLDTKTFSSSNSILPWVSYGVFSRLILSLYDNLSVMHFRDKGFNEGIASREGYYNTAGAMVTWLFWDKKASISGSYEFGYNQTEGDNYDARVNAMRTVLKVPLIEKIRGEASFSVVNDNHYNFAFLPHRVDNRFDIGGRLIRPIFKYTELRLNYGFTKVNDEHEGLLGQYAYSRHIAGGEVYFSY